MIIDHIRDLDEFKKLYESRPMPSQYNFNWLVNNPNLFCFYAEEKPYNLLGFITIQREDNELTLSGISVRKNYYNILTAIKTVCDAFDEDIYAYTPLKHAGLMLKKVGFKRVHNGDSRLQKWRLKYG